MGHEKKTVSQASGPDVLSREEGEEPVWGERVFTDAVIESLPGSLFVLDAQGRYVRGSRLHHEMLGVSPEELRGMPGLSRILEEDRPLVAAKVAEAFQHGAAEVEARTILRDNVVRHYYYSARRMQVGQEAFLVVTGIDISRRVEAEQSLRASEELTRLICENLGDAVIKVDLQGNCLYVSPSHERILGRGQEMLGSSCFAAIHPDDRERVLAVFGEAARTGEERRVEYRYDHPSKGYIWIESMGRLAWTPDGTPIAVIASRDVTERRRTEEELRHHLREIERFNRLATARELRIAELKRQINDLAAVAGQSPPYGTFREDAPAEIASLCATLATPTSPPAEETRRTYSLEDLLDRDQMQQLLESYCDAVGISSAIIDLEGRVFVGARWQRICTDFHRVNERTCARCIESDTILASQLREGEAFSLYQCRNGLTDGASPILIEGGHVGNVFIGQFFLEPPDLDYFRRQAAEFGFDEVAYLEALARVPVVPREKLPAILRYLASCARLLAELGLERIRGQAAAVDILRHAAKLDLANQELRRQREAALSLAEDAHEARVAAERSQESLRESEERLRSMTAAALDAIVMMDEQGCISFWNKAAQTIFGHSPEEACGKNLHALLAPSQYRDAWREGTSRFFRSGEGPAVGRMVELVALHKNGREFPVELSVAPLRLHGRWQALGIIRDITDRKRSRALLERAKEAAEAATKAKSEFLANMSHEIRTPMTAILGYTDLLLDDAEKPEHADALTTIKRNGEYLLSLINDILDLSRIEAGRMGLEQAVCSPVAVAEEVVSLMRVRALAKNLPLTFEPDPSVPRTIRTDPLRLRQILVNLIGNAIKFTQTGCVRLTLTATQEPRRLRFQVIDTGIGMTPQQAAAIFQPFTQVHGSAGRGWAGTGLGLAISRRLAEMLSGTLSVESEAGLGSTFTLEIDPGPLDAAAAAEDAGPRIRLPANAVPRRDLPAAGLGNARILLAEDCPDNQRLIPLLLRRVGAEVTVADNGQAAYEAAMAALESGNPFDVILMDIQMPVVDGYEATRRLRANGYVGPIIALTANAMAEDRRRSFDAGCDDYLTKPIDRASLIAAVSAHLPAHAVS